MDSCSNYDTSDDSERHVTMERILSHVRALEQQYNHLHSVNSQLQVSQQQLLQQLTQSMIRQQQQLHIIHYQQQQMLLLFQEDKERKRLHREECESVVQRLK